MNLSDTPQKTARMAGWLYLVVAIAGPILLIYIPSMTIVRGDAAATAAKMLEHEGLVRGGMALGIFTSLTFLVVALLLYRLFKPVNEHVARLMLVSVIIQIPIDFVLDAFKLAALMILKGQALKELALEQQQSMAMLMLQLAGYGTQILQILWGFWLLPLGWLIWTSRYIPRWLAVLIILNGVAYILTSIAFIARPEYHALIAKISIPVLFGELVLMLWLLIKGVKVPSSVGEPIRSVS